MPLHLLPKKSWHVYNTAAIERVRRDEAAAAAASEAAEQRMQENDAERRMALLRGEEPPPLLHAEPVADFTGPLPGPRDYERSGSSSARKRKRLRGEDETDAEMRFAKEDFAAGEAARERLVGESRKKGKGEEDRDALPLVDEKGHLQLFSAPAVEDEGDARSKESGRKRKGEQGVEKKQNEEEMGAMHFRDAAGRGSHGQKPWYASAASSATVLRSSSSHHPTDDVSGKADKGVAALDAVQDKDVWGNEDPRRRERESTRLASSDPFAAMKRAQRQLKQSERDREEWKRERLREVDPADEKERRTRKRGHRRDREGSREWRVRGEDLNEDDGLEEFSLDAPPRKERDNEREKDRERRSHHHHHRRHRREDDRHRRREDDRHHRRHRDR